MTGNLFNQPAEIDHAPDAMRCRCGRSKFRDSPFCSKCLFRLPGTLRSRLLDDDVRADTRARAMQDAIEILNQKIDPLDEAKAMAHELVERSNEDQRLVLRRAVDAPPEIPNPDG